MRRHPVALRTLSAGYVELAFMLCWKPSVCPTSCATTNSQQAAHQRIGKRKTLRARIERCDLREVPVAREIQNVVENSASSR